MAHPLDELCLLTWKYGKEKYMINEIITQESHILQAAKIAEDAGAPEQVIVAMLYHDIGQLFMRDDENNYNNRLELTTELLHYNHDEYGSQWLRKRYFPPFIVNFAKYHTIAKIVLSRTLGDKYINTLSDASKESLKLQEEKYSGNNNEKIKEFLNNPYANTYLIMRYIDDMAKESNAYTYIFEHYRTMINHVLSKPFDTTPEMYPINVPENHWTKIIENKFNDTILNK